ncbi:MAG TPA: amidophosphoribosyltransferase [Actinomycetota bacterium]|nr:amidophosphoribosyltransferase [Actinomycetota bacterium]
MGEHGEHADRPREACGVVGIHAPGTEASTLAYYGLFALQHRGQESAGIAVSEGDSVVVFKDMGLVSQVFDTERLSSLTGHIAIGHVRYSTTGSSSWENSQPSYKTTNTFGIALGHNGNLINTRELAAQIDPPTSGFRGQPAASTDSDIVATLIAESGEETAEEAIVSVLPRLQGAFSLVLMDEGTLFGARDPHGLRPLVLGRLENGYALASETCALDIIGATFIREIEPGEMVMIDDTGLRSRRFAPAKPSLCIFEFVYFARPDSKLFGKSVYKTRYQMGRRLAEEAPADADLVMGVPETAAAAAAGYSAASGIPYGEGLVKNRYVGRTFIQPTQLIRQQGIRAKLNPLHEVIEGRRIVVVDDSIVRGNTTAQIVRMLRDAGAREVHMRISSPPIKWPCFYGIDTANRDELIGAWMSVDEIRDKIGADTLHYLSLEGMVASTDVAAEKFCTACFSHDYPIPVPEHVAVTKHMLEEQPVASLLGGTAPTPTSA